MVKFFLMSERENRRLSTWKEIAAFLRCDVRTCLRWEKERGLPVHRPEGGAKSRVYAWTDELDRWLKGNANGAPAPTNPVSALPSAPAVRPGKMSLFLVAAAVIALAGLLYFGYRAIAFDRQPADFHLLGSKLQIFNKEGKPLWEFDTGLNNLKTEEAYRARFNRKTEDKESGNRTPPVIVIRDIDGDEKIEVLFTPYTESTAGAGRLWCFDFRGKLKWPPFCGGREMVFGKTTYSGDYWSQFDVLDLVGDAREEILVFSGQSPDWPTQVALLSSDGKLLGEYWHSGRILDHLVIAANGDRKKELVLCGTNNEYKRGIVAIFDPGNLAGASPNTGEFHSAALGRGTEKAYLLLPSTDIDPIDPARDWLNFAVNLDLRGNGWIYVLTKNNQIYFDIDSQTLDCRLVGFSNTFRAYHEAAVKAGRVSSVLDGAYLGKLRTSVEYWTGSEWTTTPSWVR